MQHVCKGPEIANTLPTNAFCGNNGYVVQICFNTGSVAQKIVRNHRFNLKSDSLCECLVNFSSQHLQLQTLFFPEDLMYLLLHPLFTLISPWPYGTSSGSKVTLATGRKYFSFLSPHIQLSLPRLTQDVVGQGFLLAHPHWFLPNNVFRSLLNTRVSLVMESPCIPWCHCTWPLVCSMPVSTELLIFHCQVLSSLLQALPLPLGL